MKVVEGSFGKKACADLVDVLRTLIVDVEKGELTDLVFAGVKNDKYVIGMSASLADSLVLANLLHDEALNRFKA